MTMQVDHRGGDVTHARQDPALALVSLFRPVCRGRRPGGLSIEHEHDGLRLKFNIWQALDSRDQSVLLGAVGLTGMLAGADQTGGIDEKVSHPRGQQLWSDLKPSGNAAEDRAIVIKTTRYALLQAAGLDDKARNYGLLENCLERLSMVGCRARKDGYDWSMQLLSYAETPEGQIHIALNPRFAKALSGHHVRVSLIERRALHSDTAQITHAWLSAWLRQGGSNVIRLDRLAEKVFGPPSREPATNRSRRKRIGKALEEISGLNGWSAKIEGRGINAKATIRRPTLIERE